MASSLFGACFSPMLIFRRPNTPHTRVATHRMLSEIRPPELSHGTAESCRITETMTVPKRADQASEYQEHEDPTAIRLNRLLEAPSINAGQRACPVRARTMTICCAASSGDLLPPSPPAEKPAARQDQTWQHPRWNALHHAQTPAVLDHSSALAQGDGRARPAFAGCAEGSLATTSPTNSPAPFIRHCVAFPDFCEPWPPARQATYLNFIRSRHTLQNALALASYAAVCTANCNATTPVPRANRASTSAVPIA